MPAHRIYRQTHPRKPSFFWQGALILLPAIVLCANGLYSLRQDRVIAEHDALQRARDLANTVSRHLMEGPLTARTPTDSELASIADGFEAPENDPVFKAAQATPARAAFLIAQPENRLIYPRPIPELPPPEPLDSAELMADQKAQWNVLNTALSAGQISGASDRRISDFLRSGPPERFAAIAEYKSGLACERAGLRADSTALFRKVSGVSVAVLGEDGIPLRVLADAQILSGSRLLPAALQRPLVDRLCSQLVGKPTAFSAVALDWASRQGASNESVNRWIALFAMHNRCRVIGEAVTESSRDANPVRVDGVPFFVVATKVGAGEWTQTIECAGLIDATAQILDALSLPPQFGVEVDFGGVHLWGGTPATRDDFLMTTTAQISSTRGDLPLTVRVYLTDPARFYAQQRARTFRFAVMIALSAVAVLIGFFTAWKAYRRQQRLNEMKTNFVSSVSHELRAPIASVRFMAEELELGLSPSADKLRNYHRFIVQECRRLSAVIENVLDFSRREQGRERFEFESTDLVALMEETARLMRKYGNDRKVQVETAVRGDPADVEADGRAIQRLLVNLLDNAIKHSPENSCVTAGLDFEKERVLLWVEDKGPGIPLNERSRIFERFYRIGSELRRETPGVGLGLSIVKHIAEVHGGAVEVWSEPGRGSRFTLNLPLNRAWATLALTP